MEDEGTDAGVGGEDPIDGAPGADGGGGEPDLSDFDLEAFADEIDAEALAKVKGEPKDPGAKDEGQTGKEVATKPSATIDPELQAFINKNYKGDVVAFKESLYASRAENASLKARLEALEQNQNTKPGPTRAEVVKNAIDASAEVQSFNQQIKDIDSENTSDRTRMERISEDATGLLAKIKVIEGKIESADGVDLQRLVAQKTDLKSDLSALQNEFETKKNAITSRVREKRLIESQLNRAKKDVEREMSEREKQQAADNDDVEATRQWFKDAFDTLVVKAYDLSTDQITFLRESFRTQIADYMESLGERARGFNARHMATAVQTLTEKAASNFNLQRKGAKPKSKNRPHVPRPVLAPHLPVPRAAVPNAPITRTATPSSPADLMKDPNYVRERASQVFQAAARVGAAQRGRG
jgi:hypothetical protein